MVKHRDSLLQVTKAVNPLLPQRGKVRRMFQKKTIAD